MSFFLRFVLLNERYKRHSPGMLGSCALVIIYITLTHILHTDRCWIDSVCAFLSLSPFLFLSLTHTHTKFFGGNTYATQDCMWMSRERSFICSHISRYVLTIPIQKQMIVLHINLVFDSLELNQCLNCEKNFSKWINRSKCIVRFGQPCENYASCYSNPNRFLRKILK